MQYHDLKSREIIIEDDVWIYFNSTIMKEVRIGRGAIIGANSIVTHHVEAWTVNVCFPLKVIRKVTDIKILIAITQVYDDFSRILYSRFSRIIWG